MPGQGYSGGPFRGASDLATLLFGAKKRRGLRLVGDRL